jgi:hypothetical protein
MNHVENLGNQIKVSLPLDGEGLIGRECPLHECEGYFKVQLGTGLKGENLPCYCPYCGHSAGHDKFYTRAQIEYIKSVVLNKVTDAMIKDLKTLEFNHRPQGSFGIGVSMKVEGRPHSIRYYREKQLETEVVCEQCALRYMIYGVFGFCPDCNAHNSPQILNKNLELVEKILTFAESQEPAVRHMLIANALEDCVSGFDGFGRETCRVFSNKAVNASKAANISFQNIDRSRQRILELFGVNVVQGIDPQEALHISKCFQKRHLLAHKMGVVDQEYIDQTHDMLAVIGRKISVGSEEVRALIKILRVVGKNMFDALSKKGSTINESEV